jgi:hypothetical protein
MSVALARIADQSSTAARTSRMTRAMCPVISVNSAGSVWRSTSAWITDSVIASSGGLAWGAMTSVSAPASSRFTAMTGWMIRWTR